MLSRLMFIMVLLWPLMLSGEIQPKVDWQDIVILAEDYPPLNYIENGQEMGSSVELLRAVFAQLNLPDPQIQWVPWQRAYGLALSDRPVMVLTMTRAQSRELLFQWAGPTHVARHLLVKRADSQVGIDVDPLVAQNAAIVAVRNDISSLVLREKDYPTHLIAEVDTFRAAVTLLVSGRMPFASVPENGFRVLIQQMGLSPADFEVVQIIQEVHGYFAFSQAFPGHLIEDFQKALDSISDQHRAILAEYQLNL